MNSVLVDLLFIGVMLLLILSFFQRLLIVLLLATLPNSSSDFEFLISNNSKIKSFESFQNLPHFTILQASYTRGAKSFQLAQTAGWPEISQLPTLKFW